MQASESSSGTAGAVATLVLAGSAALAFGVGDLVGFRTEGAETVSTTTWLLGWALLTWAVLVGGACAVQAVRAPAPRRRPARAGLLLLLAAAVVVAVVGTHLPFGSGSGSG
ncbi:hypothetical protein GTQ99_18710 [Kineococcus sp. T13]|uniref:hypothetical protein n=1 Tax=Kineococcus vitellinus TaxID=2696565 RepID=UPI0014136785|nr:hypothetical protein [Kineococcus vitellinus]NAZ77438.1 hypothetical protein [Kineococcus vitellinus]